MKNQIILSLSTVLLLAGCNSGSTPVVANPSDVGEVSVENSYEEATAKLTAFHTLHATSTIEEPSNCPICKAKKPELFVCNPKQNISLEKIATYNTGIFDESAAEIVAYDTKSKRFFVTNASTNSVDILMLKNGILDKVQEISMDAYGGVNSVAAYEGLIAVAVQAKEKQENGKILFFDCFGTLLKSVEAGALPDMVTFSKNGKILMSANEGEPSSDYSKDPNGSITIVDVSRGIEQAIAKTIDFRGVTMPQTGMKFYSEDKVADVEPEYIAISDCMTKAYVTLQENNGVAVVDIINAKIEKILPLGFKDFSLKGNEIDAHNNDRVEFVNIPAFGMYQPDSISTYRVEGKEYFITANEGDDREYDAYKEEKKLSKVDIDPDFDISSIKGDIRVTTELGDTDGDGDLDELYMMGTRSFSIWDAEGNQVFDSGSQFARIVADHVGYDGSKFNTRVKKGKFKNENRSEKKGVEPEALTIAKIAGKTYAFIGLEKQGGIFIYDITDPKEVKFISYKNEIDYDKNPQEAGDLGPEGMVFIPKAKSPNGKDLLVVANEVSGTTSIYEVVANEEFKLSILHVNDTHSHLASETMKLKFNGVSTYTEVGGYPRVISKINDLQARGLNTLTLNAGDTFQGTLYYSLFKGEADSAMLNMTNWDAIELGNHEFDDGDAHLASYLKSLNPNFNILAANVEAPAGNVLENLWSPYIIKEFDGQKVGVIGLDIVGKTQESSSPSDEIEFLDEVLTAQRYIDELKCQKVDKIVLLTHVGYNNDIDFASRLSGVDVIVGGDSHSLLGDFSALGLLSDQNGAYPTIATSLDGDKVCVVQAWQYAYAVGSLDVVFDKEGKVKSCQGEATVLLGESFKQKDADGKKVLVSDDVKEEILKIVNQNPYVQQIHEDSDALGTLAVYSEQVESQKSVKIGTVAEFLGHNRFPMDKKDGVSELALGSDIAPIVAKSFYELSKRADACIQNAGGVRTSIADGEVTMGDAYALLPFANTLFEIDMLGSEVKQVLEDALTFASSPDGSTGAFPYAYALRYDVDMSAADNDKISNLEIKDRESGVWSMIDDTAMYTIVTNSYIAAGKDGYSTFKTVQELRGKGVDTYLDYALSFVRYVETREANGESVTKLLAQEHPIKSYK